MTRTETRSISSSAPRTRRREARRRDSSFSAKERTDLQTNRVEVDDCIIPASTPLIVEFPVSVCSPPESSIPVPGCEVPPTLVPVTSPTDGTTTTQPVGLTDDGVFYPSGFGIADRDGPDPRLILVDPNTMGGLAVLDLPLQGIAPVRLPVDFVPRRAAVADLDEDREDELLVTSVAQTPSASS